MQVMDRESLYACEKSIGNLVSSFWGYGCPNADKLDAAFAVIREAIEFQRSLEPKPYPTVKYIPEKGVDYD